MNQLQKARRLAGQNNVKIDQETEKALRSLESMHRMCQGGNKKPSEIYKALKMKKSA